MITVWEPLVDALRDELQEYGDLLNLFDEQQAAILRREPDAVLATGDSITAQLKTVGSRRKRREALARESAELLNRPPESSLRELTQFFPQTVQALFQALIDEVNQLLSRTKRRAHQNQMLLARSVEVSQDILCRLDPGAMTKSYSPEGRLNIGLNGSTSRCLARG